MCPFVNIILLVFISTTGRIVLTNCESNDVGSGIVQTLEQLLLETRSNFDELRSEIQLLKGTMDRQLEMNVRLEEMMKRMLHRINATDHCEVALLKDYCDALNEFNSSFQRVQSGADHVITTSGSHRLVSRKYQSFFMTIVCR